MGVETRSQMTMQSVQWQCQSRENLSVSVSRLSGHVSLLRERGVGGREERREGMVEGVVERRRDGGGNGRGGGREKERRGGMVEGVVERRRDGREW